MAKTKQIGVRFTTELLEATGLTPQKALNLYEQYYALFIGKKGNEHIGKEVFSTMADTTEVKKVVPITNNPKNLQELKDLCPKELTGMDRSEWVSENRVKFNL